MSSKKSNNANNSNNNNGPKEANLAYFIQISETTVAHLPRLLARLYHARNVYVIHFDMKVDKTLVARLKRNMLKRNRKYESNVRFMPSELITYRGVSMLLNTINAMRQLLDLSSDWHYFINISGADYPMIPQVMLRQLLGRYIDDEWNFVTFAPTGTWDSNLRHRLENIYVDDALSFQSESGEVRQLDVINPIAESMRLRYTNAEAWMINSRSFCHYVINSGYARKLLLTFAYSVEASEHYFATLVWNHPIYNRTIINDAMRGVLWFFEGQSAGQHPFYVDEKKPDGKFKFETILLDIPTFFIRKFRNADSPLMDVVDKQWNNDTHLKRVREKLDWHVQVSTDEHKIKPTLSPTVMQQYSLRRRRR